MLKTYRELRKDVDNLIAALKTADTIEEQQLIEARIDETSKEMYFVLGMEVED